MNLGTNFNALHLPSQVLSVFKDVFHCKIEMKKIRAREDGESYVELFLYIWRFRRLLTSPMCFRIGFLAYPLLTAYSSEVSRWLYLVFINVYIILWDVLPIWMHFLIDFYQTFEVTWLQKKPKKKSTILVFFCIQIGGTSLIIILLLLCAS